MTEVYSPEDVKAILELIQENPNGFMRLARKHCKNVKPWEYKRSMKAWGINYTEEVDARRSGDRAPRRRKNYRNTTVSPS